MTDLFMTTSDLAERLRVSPDTVKKWRKTNAGPPAIRVGRVIRYRESDVMDWLRERCQTRRAA